MSGTEPEPAALRFLFDPHVNGVAMRALRKRGIDVMHTTDAGLERAYDPVILQWARGEGRILVTHNYRDFAPLVRALARTEQRFPGVLFLAQSIHTGDVGAHVRALESWIARCEAAGMNLVESSFAWLR